MVYNPLDPPIDVDMFDSRTGKLAEIWRKYFRRVGTLVSGSAPIDGVYWTGESAAGLSAEENIGALATGYLKVTVALGHATPSTVAKIPAATDLSGLVPTANLGTGVADATTFLRGDQTYAAGGGGTGPTGATGAMGMPGQDGLDGVDGLQGPAGASGAAGAAGPMGFGLDGLDGQDGNDGPPGPAGTAGSAGIAGAAGSTGPMGVAGESGDDSAPFIGVPSAYIQRSHLAPGALGMTLLGEASGATTTIGPVIWTGTFLNFYIDYFIAGYNGGTPVGRWLCGAAAISTTALTNGSSLDQGPAAAFAAQTNTPSIPGCPLAIALTNIPRRGSIIVRGASGALKTYEVIGANGAPSVTVANTFFRAIGSFSDLGTNLPLQRMQLTVYDTLVAVAASAQTFTAGSYLRVWGWN